MIVPILCCKRNSVFLLQSIPLRLQSIPLRFQCIQYHSSRKVYFCLSPCAWCKTRQGDAVAGWKYSSLLGGFSASHSINGSSEPFCIKRKGFFLFLFFISDTSLKLRALHWLAFRNNLSSYPEMLNPTFFARKLLISFIFSAAKKSLHRQFAHR